MSKILAVKTMDLFCFGPPVFFMTSITNYMLLYSTLLGKRIARAPGGHKNFVLTKLGGQNRIDPKQLWKIYFWCLNGK